MAKGKVIAIIIVILVVCVALLQYTGQLDLIGSDVGLPSGSDIKDTDGDGVQDKFDDCPTVAGSVYNNGCPDETGTPPPTTTPAPTQPPTTTPAPTTAPPTTTLPPTTSPPDVLSLGPKDYPVEWYNVSSSCDTPNDIGTPSLQWQAIPEGPYFASRPSIGYGNVYFKMGDSYLYCYDEATGTQQWKALLNSGGVTFPSLYDGNVYVMDGNFIRCHDALSGEYRWDLDTGGMPAPVMPFMIADGKIFTGNSGVDCYDLETRDLLWTYEHPQSNVRYSNIVYADGKVFACTASHAFCIDVSTGGQVWSVDVPDQTGLKLSYHQGHLLVSNIQGTLTCIDVSTGTQKWELSLPNPSMDYILSPAAAADGRVYFVVTNDSLYCYDIDTGTQIWKENVAGISNFVPHLGQDQVIVLIWPQSGPCIRAYDIGNRQIQWNLPIDTLPLYSMANDRLYIQYQDFVACYG